MTLRWRISLTVFTLRFGLAAGMVVGGLPTAVPWIGVPAAIIWALFGTPVLRQCVLPLLFPATTCPGCRRLLPLEGRWKCGDHYVDHRDRHILAFRCTHGHFLEGFDCPRCRATILVQRGEQKYFRHGTALRLKALGGIPDASDGALLLGHDERKRQVGLPAHRLAWHMAITGGTGRGKSTLLCNLARQLLRQNIGFTVLDPGGDLARAVIQQVPPSREADVLYIDVGDLAHPCPLNVLSAADDIERGVLTEELLGVFHKLHGTAWGPLLAYQLRMALRAVMEADGTLRDVFNMFVSGNTRSHILNHVHDPAVRGFWLEEFPTIPAMRRSAVTNKLAPVVFHPVLAKILCAKNCVLDADAVIGQRRIVVVNLATGTPGDDVTTLLGTFIVHKIMAAAFRQGRKPPEQRKRHILIVDEFQRFVHQAVAFDQILAEARKFALSLVVSNQFVEQLSPAVRAALFGNVGCLAAFRVGHRDARVLTPEFTGAIPEDLLELGLGQCVTRIGTDWTLVRTPPPANVPDDDPTARIIAANRQQFAQLTAAAPAPLEPVGDEDEEEAEFVQ